MKKENLNKILGRNEITYLVEVDKHINLDKKILITGANIIRFNY